jgi:hypothetical protein
LKKVSSTKAFFGMVILGICISVDMWLIIFWPLFLLGALLFLAGVVELSIKGALVALERKQQESQEKD